jgi:hypothetical protein
MRFCRLDVEVMVSEALGSWGWSSNLLATNNCRQLLLCQYDGAGIGAAADMDDGQAAMAYG